MKFVVKNISYLWCGKVKDSSTAVKIPGKMPYLLGSNIKNGLRTPTDKIELYSKTIEKFKENHKLDLLPTYRDLLNKGNKKKYLFIYAYA